MSLIKNLQKNSFSIFISFLILSLFLPACSEAQKKNPDAKEVQIAKSDPWTENDIIMPETLTAELKNNKEKPLIIQTGFKMLYDQEHIPNSIFTGPASINKGLVTLKDTLKNVNRNQYIVLYCGCCKWKECPNIRPAFKAVKEMGFKNAKLLYLKNTFMIDWVNRGYPAEH